MERNTSSIAELTESQTDLNLPTLSLQPQSTTTGRRNGNRKKAIYSKTK
jgi:hypothetical protein